MGLPFFDCAAVFTIGSWCPALASHSLGGKPFPSHCLVHIVLTYVKFSLGLKNTMGGG